MKRTQVHEIIKTAWPDDTVTVRDIQRLMKEFSDGERNSFDRMDGSGRRVSDVRNEIISLVEESVNSNNSLSVRDIADMHDLSFGMVLRILNDDLGKTWFHTRWVPHTLTEANKRTRIEQCIEMLDAFKSRIVKANLMKIDKKWFVENREHIWCMAWTGRRENQQKCRKPLRR